MVDEPWGEGTEGEVAQLVAADEHGTALVAEGIDDVLQHVLVAVEVVRVKLDGIASALGVTHGQVPAASDAQVSALGNELHNLLAC